MEAHKEQHKKSIRFFNDREVRAVWDDEHNKWWFSVLDIIAAINARKMITKRRETIGSNQRIGNCHQTM